MIYLRFYDFHFSPAFLSAIMDFRVKTRPKKLETNFFVSLGPYEEIKTKIKVVPKKSRQPLYFEVAALTTCRCVFQMSHNRG